VLSENEGFVEGVVEEREYVVLEGRKLDRSGWYVTATPRGRDSLINYVSGQLKKGYHPKLDTCQYLAVMPDSSRSRLNSLLYAIVIKNKTWYRSFLTRLIPTINSSLKNPSDEGIKHTELLIKFVLDFPS
jgi:hypothetical protein